MPMSFLSRRIVREWFSLWLVATGLFLGLHLLCSLDWGQGTERALLLFGMAWLVGLLATKPPLPQLTSRALRIFVILLLLASLAYHSYRAYHFIRQGTGFIDILTITLDAGDQLLKGRNPYTQKIDTQWSNPRYQGFKYSPLMMIVYLPTRWLGPHSVVFFHLLINITIAFLLFLLCRRHLGDIPGYLASALYLAVPVVSYESYNHGVNDTVGTALVLGALLCLHRPGWVGLLLGLSVSTKLMPAALCTFALVSRAGFFRYSLGFAVGILPVAVAFLLSPQAFWDNVIHFPLSRPIDTTSWLFAQPSWVVKSAKIVFAHIVLCVFLFALFLKHSIHSRILLAFFLLTASLLNSGAVHRNYFLWWFPFLLLGTLFGMYSSHNSSFTNVDTENRDT